MQGRGEREREREQRERREFDGVKIERLRDYHGKEREYIKVCFFVYAHLD